MKGIKIHLCILVLTTLTWQCLGSETSEENLIQNDQAKLEVTDVNIGSSESSTRFRRQSLTTTTPRPKKKRPSNIFSLISVLLTETREDTNRAFNEIGTLFNSQFTENNATTKKEQTTTTTTPIPSSSSDDDEDNEITTTTEPYRISRDEFFGILRSNVQGIVQLFGKEFRVALRDSNQNVREFGRDLGIALRPYFT